MTQAPEQIPPHGEDTGEGGCPSAAHGRSRRSRCPHCGSLQPVEDPAWQPVDVADPTQEQLVSFWSSSQSCAASHRAASCLPAALSSSSAPGSQQVHNLKPSFHQKLGFLVKRRCLSTRSREEQAEAAVSHGQQCLDRPRAPGPLPVARLARDTGALLGMGAVLQEEKVWASPGPQESKPTLTSTLLPRAFYCLYLTLIHQPPRACSHRPQQCWRPQHAPCPWAAPPVPSAVGLTNLPGTRNPSKTAKPGSIPPSPWPCLHRRAAAGQDNAARVCSGDPMSLRTPCGTRRWWWHQGGSPLAAGPPLCSHPSSWLQSGPCRGGRQDGAGLCQEVSGLLLSDDVPHAGVQEHVLVLRKRRVLESGL